MRRFPWWAAALAAAAVGAGVGAAVAAAGHVEYRAEAKVVVQGKGGPSTVRPLLPNLRELATSSILAGNVDSTLRLPGSPDSLRKRLHAVIAPSSEVIVVSVTDQKHDRARQIAQEAAVVFAQLVQARFGLKGTILDPAHVVGRQGPHFVRDPLIGAAIGLVLALAGLLSLRRAPIAAPTDEKLAARERQLRERIDLVTKRERELAKRAGELAKREREVDERAAQVRTEIRPAPEPEPEPEPEPVAVPVPVPEPTLALPPEPVSPAGTTPPLNINELERLVEARTDVSPEVAEQWRTYLFFLRGHAAADGHLPPQFASLVEEVFTELIDRT